MVNPGVFILSPHTQAKQIWCRFVGATTTQIKPDTYQTFRTGRDQQSAYHNSTHKTVYIYVITTERMVVFKNVFSSIFRLVRRA